MMKGRRRHIEGDVLEHFVVFLTVIKNKTVSLQYVVTGFYVVRNLVTFCHFHVNYSVLLQKKKCILFSTVLSNSRN